MLICDAKGTKVLQNSLPSYINAKIWKVTNANIKEVSYSTNCECAKKRIRNCEYEKEPLTRTSPNAHPTTRIHKGQMKR